MIVQDGETGIGEAQESPSTLLSWTSCCPGCDGFEVLRRIRELGITSRVIMLTARGEIDDRVTGLSTWRRRLFIETFRYAGIGGAS